MRISEMEKTEKEKKQSLFTDGYVWSYRFDETWIVSKLKENQVGPPVSANVEHSLLMAETV